MQNTAPFFSVGVSEFKHSTISDIPIEKNGTATSFMQGPSGPLFSEPLGEPQPIRNSTVTKLSILFRSRDVADVNVGLSFNPNVINMENKNCKMNNKETVCIFATFCFKIIIKSGTNKQETFDLEYKITLDSHRFLSRSLFTDTNGRTVQGVIRQSGECANHNFYMVEKPDFLNSVNVSVEFNFKDPEDGPVLSQEIPNIVNAHIPFTMDCGAEKRCMADLVLAAQLMMGDKSFNQTVVKYNKDKFNVTVTLRNKWDSAYNPTVTMKYSPNIILAGIEDKPKVSCESDTDFTCKVGYPFLKREESITFTVTFQFNISHLLDTVSILINAVSDSDEKNLNDNRKNIIFPVKYESWLTFTGSKKEFHISIPANDSIPAVINSMDAIGPEINLNYVVKKNDYIPMPIVIFRLSFHYKTPDGNVLLYLTNLSHSDNVNCDIDKLLDPLRISAGRIYHLETFTESLKDTILDCKRDSCPAFYCTVEPSDITHINISMRVWKATFIKVIGSFLMIFLHNGFKQFSIIILYILHHFENIYLLCSTTQMSLYGFYVHENQSTWWSWKGPPGSTEQGVGSDDPGGPFQLYHSRILMNIDTI
ncbi:hypothetical protein GDO78_021760 [Eleutherodactylus coqui]|uniref:Integrin alpha-2 domain-containing protein n=1 Tax=Eleutherodactylus coqui TaxID=57060 RepID=A0A8J6BA34_ELECQ|nr:hypothetical protein GDO78_021760 [Eleutherodactylus coqui]